jgi:two-component system sensor histidine kinase TctE
VPRKGLGLEIARSFAAAHGSDVVLVPREGGGACARIDLPAVEDSDRPAPEGG